MKKMLVSMLLAVALVAPVFATEKGDMEIVGKLGFAVNPVVNYCYGSYWNADSYDRNPALSIAVEGLYSVLPELPVGLGINYQFDSKEKGDDNYESGATNIYLTAKPIAKIDSKIFTALYAIGQIGYGLNRFDGKDFGKYEVDGNGLYWGLGAGTEIMNDFIFEFVFSTNYWSSKYERPGYSHTEDMVTTALTLFVGYKFAI